MPFPPRTRATDEVVAPTLVDPLARASSAAVGGPLGRHARSGWSWWTPLRVIVLVAIVMFGVGVFQKSPCEQSTWPVSPRQYSHMCYSDIGFLYAGRGFAEGILPFEPHSDLPANKQPTSVQESNDLSLEYPVLTGVWMEGASLVTHLIGDSPNLSNVPHSQVGGMASVQHDSTVFWAVNAFGFFLVLLLALILLIRAQPRRPWDAMFIAASPALALTAFINWDMLAIGCVAGILWAWATRRTVLAGLFIGLGTATKLYPVLLIGPLLILCLRERKMQTWVKTVAAALTTWLIIDLPVYIWSPDGFLYFWRFNAARGPDLGSAWLIGYFFGHGASPHQINVTTWVVFGGACLLIAALGLLAPRRPRFVQLAFLVVACFLLINKVYSPQYVLWLLPLAALARPRWRDMLIWQACEVFYFFAVWMHLANFFVPAGACTSGGFFASFHGCDWVYILSILIRMAGEIYLIVMVVRDILSPWRDPVRSDGLSDDPLGGIFDEGIDSEPIPAAEPTLVGADSAAEGWWDHEDPGP
ncbi:MAG: glycosyltransferase family 87 protein [Nocardioidaceae bacterium]